MTEAARSPILDAVFHELRARGVAVGIRDYCDALRALRIGYGVGNRNHLRRLCHALWARSEDERRIVDMVFEAIPPPTDDEITAVAPSLRLTSGDGSEWPPDRQAKEEGADEAGAPVPAATLEPRAGIEFVSHRGESDLPLPRLGVGALARSETFVVEPQAPVAERTLAILWRRLRSPSRTRHRIGRDVDVAATIGDYCRHGALANLAYRPQRLNTARLLILADASPSMAPWSPLLSALSRSLAHGRLQSSELFYFSNWPRQLLFRTSLLTEPEPMERVLRDNAGAALLILGDAGAARGTFDRRRLDATDAFLGRDCRRHELRPIVWINPVPRVFWAGTTAAALHQRSRASFLPLDETSLIRAVDILRGAKAA